MAGILRSVEHEPLDGYGVTTWSSVALVVTTTPSDWTALLTLPGRV
jgi:hypothetical protein